MASIRKRKNKNGSITYYADIVIKRGGDIVHREGRSFNKLALAKAWSEKRQREIEHAQIHGESSREPLKTIIQRYQDQFSHNYGRTKNYAIAQLLNYPIAELTINQLSVKHIIQHCIERNREAQPQTVANDVIWLRTILRTMSATEGFYYDPSVFERALVVLKQEKLVGRSKERTRRPTPQELWKLSRYFYHRKSKIPMLQIMWFALYSARRMSEITRLEWADNNTQRLTGMVRDAKDPRHKKGNHKRFKYTPSAWKIVCRQPRNGALIFPYNPQTIGETFRRACKLLGIDNLHFHDLRHEATSRLFEAGYSIEQVQLFTLHDDWKTLARYTHLRPEDID